MELDGVADELYGLAPEEFTATRNARAKQARAAGDRQLATEIGRLAKPSTVAWLANQLIREHHDQVVPLLELGVGLREATAALSGAALRELSRQQHQLVNALVGQARELAVAAGHRVSDDIARGLETTLYAALADDAAAEHLAAGRLTEALQHTGFGADIGPLTPAGAPTAPPRSSPAKRRPAAEGLEAAAKLRDAARRAAAADHDVTQARAAAEQAAAAQQEARAEAERAERELADAVAAQDRARAELDDATAARVRAEQSRREARAAAERAGKAGAEAEQLLRDAVSRQQRLSETTEE